jgi:hypothetical protein
MVIFNPSRGASEESAAAGKALTGMGAMDDFDDCVHNLHQYFDATMYLTFWASWIRINQAE